MHELSVCASIADAVRARAGDREVVSVQLRIGYLRQFVPDTLVFCWEMVCDNTPLAGSRLEIEHIPAEVECADCGARSRLEHPLMICPQCSGGLVTVVAGEECMVTSMELKDLVVPDGSLAPAVPGDPRDPAAPDKE